MKDGIHLCVVVVLGCVVSCLLLVVELVLLLVHNNKFMKLFSQMMSYLTIDTVVIS